LFAQKMLHHAPPARSNSEPINWTDIVKSGIDTAESKEICEPAPSKVEGPSPPKDYQRTRSSSGENPSECKLPQLVMEGMPASQEASMFSKGGDSCSMVSLPTYSQALFRKAFEEIQKKKEILSKDIYNLESDLVLEGRKLLKGVAEVMQDLQQLTFKYLGCTSGRIRILLYYREGDAPAEDFRTEALCLLLRLIQYSEASR